ncbi:MAG TPA: hypothetical protein VFB27_02655 [Opitutaceae bacterium]|nr:hypothetical protein [Opitutaceae bacterium]
MKMSKFPLHFALLTAALLDAGVTLHAQSTGLVVTSSNNVGVGTASPVAKLNVKSPAGATDVIRADMSTGSGQFDVREDASNYPKVYLYDAAGNVNVFVSPTGNSYFTGGNIGIGTNSPAAPLTVAADGGSTSTAMRVERGAGNTARLELNYEHIQKYDGSGNVNNLLLNPSGGNVGIGTTTPGTSLDVYSSTQSATANPGTSALRVTAAQGANPKFLNVGYDPSLDVGYLQPVHSGSGGFFSNLILNPNGGKIGIGITSPTQLLHLYSTANTQETIESTGAANYVGLNLKSGALTWQLGNNSNVTNHPLIFQDGTHTNMSLLDNGNVGIGTISPVYPLDVAGSVHATSFVSSTTTYADFVFKPDYKLAPLSQVEAAIKQDGHLPGIPSEEEAKVHGIDLAQMQVKLLQKIEELTLHQIEQQKELSAQQSQLANQQRRLDAQATRIEQLEKENTTLRSAR